MVDHRTPSPARTAGALGVQVGALARVGEAPLANAPPAPSTLDTVKDTALGKSKPMIVGVATAAGGILGYLFSGFGALGGAAGALAGNLLTRFGAKSYCDKNPGPDCLDPTPPGK